jgi:hypothetical protein
MSSTLRRVPGVVGAIPGLIARSRWCSQLQKNLLETSSRRRATGVPGGWSPKAGVARRVIFAPAWVHAAELRAVCPG